MVYVKEVAFVLAAQGHQNVNIVRIPCGPKKFLSKEQLWPYLGQEWAPNIQYIYLSTGAIPDVFTAHYGDGGLTEALLAKETNKPYTFTGHSLGAHKMEKLQASPENLVIGNGSHYGSWRSG